MTDRFALSALLPIGRWIAAFTGMTNENRSGDPNPSVTPAKAGVQKCRLPAAFAAMTALVATPAAAQEAEARGFIYRTVCIDAPGAAVGTNLLYTVIAVLLGFLALFVAIEMSRKVEGDDGALLTFRERRRIARQEARQQSGTDYLVSLPERWVRLYIPLAVIVFVLLFPFYWMGITAIKPDAQLIDLDTVNPYWVDGPTMDHIHSLLCETDYMHWMWNTMFIAIVATVLSLISSVLAAYAIVRLRYKGAQTVGGLIFLAYLVPPSILFIPLSIMLSQYEVAGYKLWDTPWALILTYPTILIPFSTWLLMGYFKTIPFELEECALIDGATRWQILTKIVLPLAGPGLISAGIFCFTLCWNEFIYALTFISTPANKTVPTAILSEMVDGDVYRWGSLMAGALFGSIPVALVYMFFVNHYVSAMTGAVKE